MAVIIERMQSARGTAAQWTSANPVLLAGELGWESDTGKIKFGDGTTAWTSLPYFTVSDATKAPLASPTFTGDPKAPTPSAGDNDTSIATTAFVNSFARPAYVNTGTATLVAGTIAVTGKTSATLNTVVHLAHKTLGGTPGALFISAKTAGTGFTIKSTSSTDTSVVQYDVLSW